MSWFDNVKKVVAEGQLPNVVIVNGITYTYEKLAEHDPEKIPLKKEKGIKYTLILKIWDIEITKDAKYPLEEIELDHKKKRALPKDKQPETTKWENLQELIKEVKLANADEKGVKCKLWLTPSQAKQFGKVLIDAGLPIVGAHCAITHKREGEGYETKHIFEVVNK